MTVYRAAAPEALRVVELDALTSVYHRPAGATHLLAEPAPEIIVALQEGPADIETLLVRLSERYDIDPAARDGIAARLEELVIAGLVAIA